MKTILWIVSAVKSNYFLSLSDLLNLLLVVAAKQASFSRHGLIGSDSPCRLTNLVSFSVLSGE